MDDEEMEEALPPVPVFFCFEVDLDYELDAPKYFDLSRDESSAEIWAAECWFETAGSYPPSPLLAKITAANDVLMDSKNFISNLENLDYSSTLSVHQDVAAPGFSVVHDNKNEQIVQNSVMQDVPKVDNRFAVKTTFQRGSTLMKPTASQLAKQNRPRQMKSASRLQKQVEVKKERSFEDLNDHAHQAPKRQKLERGHFCKAVDIKQQIDLFHKVPEKKNELVDSSTHLPRLRLTIPREPELQTARRALTSRAQKLSALSLMEEMPSTSTSTFKARPLNRKILEAPSLSFPQKSTPRSPKFKEFNFKTHDRAIQHRAITSSSVIVGQIPIMQWDAKGLLGTHFQSSGNQLLQNSNCKRMEKHDLVSVKFKAQPLNKKILSNKGDIGVIRNTKWESTRPKEVQFSTTKKSQQAPLSELFNKLTLSSELHKTAALPKFPLPSYVDIKDSKENMMNGVQR